MKDITFDMITTDDKSVNMRNMLDAIQMLMDEYDLSYDFSKEIISKYKAHANNSGGRCEFLLSVKEWWDFWRTDNRWDNRGNKPENYVMARVCDIGPYHKDNIYCCTIRENLIHCKGGLNITEEVFNMYKRNREIYPEWYEDNIA